MFFHPGMEMHNQRALNFSHGPSALSGSMGLPYMYNGITGPMVSNANQPGSYTAPGSFGMQHIDPTQVVQTEHGGVRSPGAHGPSHDNMFSFGGDSDGEDKEPTAFADRTLMMQQEFSHSMDDPNMDIGGASRGLQ